MIQQVRKFVTRGPVVAVGAVALIATIGISTATAAATVGSAEIINQSIQSWDVATEGIGKAEVRPDAVGASEVRGRSISGDELDVRVESDGPYPGATDLGALEGQGDNSDEMVPADGNRHTVWVECAPGKLATGGGYRLAADQTVAAAKAIHVIASEPRGDAIPGDAAQSVLPIGWQVEVVNDGDTAQIVRPWVVCADLS